MSPSRMCGVFTRHGALSPTMQLFVAISLLATLITALNPEDCDVAVRDETEYTCQLPNGTITLGAMKNEYVNVLCEGTNINCSDLPFFDFGSGKPLRSIGLRYCPPSILSCINEVVDSPSVNRLTLVSTTEPLEGQDVAKLGAVKALTLRNAGAQNTLPIAAIKNLPTLREVRIGGGNMQLSPNAFQGSPPLEYLEFSEDKLTNIPSDAFVGLSKLVHLNIWGNNVTKIGPGAFRGLNELKKLSLSTNEISVIEPGTLDDLTNLGELCVMKNNIEILSNGLLGNLKLLQNVTLIYNKRELKFGDRAFSKLPSLKKIVLEYNYIKKIPQELLLDSINLEYLSLKYNGLEELPKKFLEKMVALKYLDFSHNKIKNMEKSVFYDVKNLEFLDLSYNALEDLPGDLFAGLRNLKEINFDHNSIYTIDSNTFRGLNNLHILSMAYNKLTLDIDNSLHYGATLYQSPFSPLAKLKKLNLMYNEISTIFDDWRLNMNHLELLDLRHNVFTNISLDQDPAATYFLSRNITVDLRNNDITSIFVTLTPYTGEYKPQTRTLLLENNPFKCDCNMYAVKLRISGDVYMPNEPKLAIDEATCSLPLSLNGVKVKDVDKNDLICENSDIIADDCKTIVKPGTNELIFDCNKFPAELPDMNNEEILEFYNKEPTITVISKKQPNNLKNLNIHKLDLSNAGLNSIQFKPNTDLKVIDLSNNDIKNVPMEFLKANISIYLTNNPLECNCWNVDDIEMIKNSKFIFNASCEDGRLIDQIDIQSLCSMQKAVAVSVGSFVLIVILAFITIIFIYKYFNEIIIFMISRGICKNCVKSIQNDKQFDVFISFAHEDLDLVQNILLPKLEKDFGQKVCVHYRDWVVGELIPTQINNSIENSRKTIIILSKNFLESMWANLEFITAHNLTKLENSARIILILVDENLTHDAKLSSELKAYIKTNTYLLWGDQNFWKKLDRALERNNYKITWLDAFKQGGEKSKKGGLDVQLQNGQLVNMAPQYDKLTTNFSLDSV